MMELRHRVKKLNGAWCVQRYAPHNFVKHGESTTVWVWELVSVHDTQPEAYKRTQEILFPTKVDHDEMIHHKEPCS